MRIRAYVTVLSVGIFLISSWFINLIVFVPGMSWYPCANLPSSTHISFFHLSFKIGSLIRVFYFMMVSLVTGCTTPFAYSSISICGVVGSSSFTKLFGMDHSGVSNTALPKYDYNACGEMLAGALGEIIISACSCNRWDLLRTSWWITLVGALSSSWVIGAYAWQELDGGVSCEKRLGVLYGSLKYMVFLFSNGITQHCLSMSTMLAGRCLLALLEK